jgi:hypothetical protein
MHLGAVGLFYSINMNRYLTKSKFKLALECTAKLYYQSNKAYKKNKLDNDFLKTLAKGGFQVGELAKCYESKIKNSRYLVEASINYWCV